MNMVSSNDESAKLLRESSARFFDGAGTIAALRRNRAVRDFSSLARGAWEGMIQLGLPGILVPEEFGGVGMSFAASAQVAEEMGRTLATGPFISTAVMAVTAITGGDNAEVKAALLPRIAAGSVCTLASEETARHAPHQVTTTARGKSNDFKISGRKIAVMEGNIAETLIVSARFNDGSDIGLFVVDASASGVTITCGLGMDSRPVATIDFNNAESKALVCNPAKTLALVDRTYDAGRIHLAAEMLGGMQDAFTRAVEYMKVRVQFGKKIGEFQALQHRAAMLFGELEIARSVVRRAAKEAPESERFAYYASLSKAKVGEVAKRIVTEAIQFHGGIGVTDDFDLGLYLKRARVAAESLGDWAFHAERLAQMKGL